MSDDPVSDVKRCAKCAAWIPATATMCAYCNTTSPDAPLARTPGPMLSIRHGVSVTQVLIAVNCAFFAFSLVVAGARHIEGNPLQWALTGSGFQVGVWLAGGYLHGSVAGGQWWRVISAVFLHYGAIHIGLNMLALRDVGRLAEDLFGAAKFLTVYLVTGAASMGTISLWYVYLHPRDGAGPLAAGASGAIFGIMGLLTVFLLRAGTDRGRTIGMALAKNVVFMLALGFFVPVISNTAHVGGLVVGALFGFVLKDQFSARFNPESRLTWTRIASVCVGVTLVALVFAARFALTWKGD
jgi:membrane associated rhomboid family serine protease